MKLILFNNKKQARLAFTLFLFLYSKNENIQFGTIIKNNNNKNRTRLNNINNVIDKNKMKTTFNYLKI